MAFHLDPLWADPEIDLVGIDNYMPLSDWRDGWNHLAAQTAGAIYEQRYLRGNIKGGQGFDWFAELDRHLTEPPANPGDGARYIVAAGGIGAWSGWDLNIAYYVDDTWIRLVPRAGWVAWVEDASMLLVWTGTAWAEVGGGAGGDGVFATLGVGGATADATNRLAVAATPSACRPARSIRRSNTTPPAPGGPPSR